MKTKTEKPDSRPRFGWCSCLDYKPQIIHEDKLQSDLLPVVVIPLPCMSPALKAKIRAFANGTLWPRK